MIPLAQWERLSGLVEAKVSLGTGRHYWRLKTQPPPHSVVLYGCSEEWWVDLKRTANDKDLAPFIAWATRLFGYLGTYVHFNRTGIIVGRGKSPFLRKSFSYDAQGNIAPALILALLAALEAAPDLQEEICK